MGRQQDPPAGGRHADRFALAHSAVFLAGFFLSGAYSVHLGEEKIEDVTLVPVAPRQFEAELPPIESSTYPVTVIERRGRREVSERTVLVSIPDQDEEPHEEWQSSRANTPLLEELAAATGGKFNPTAHEVVAREPGTHRLRYDLDMLFIPLAMLCFLGDVAVRRLWMGAEGTTDEHG